MGDNDYQVDLGELAAASRTLDGIRGTAMGNVNSAHADVFIGDWNGGKAAKSCADVIAALAKAQSNVDAHFASHVDTLQIIAQKYQAQEDDAQTAIRGFFSGRIQP